ncbi:MAG: serine hydrolase [Gemmatimonadales bacterium]|nr:serine hydrolase [Gemmatimonadales bacterium]
MSRRFASSLPSLLMTALAATPVLSAQQITSAQRSLIDSTVARLFDLKLAPGLGIVVVRDTQIVYVKGFGLADVEAGRPFTPQTVFYVASTTKAFTGLAAAILDAQGSFRLDAPLSRYLPGVKLRAPLNPDSITIRSLLTHTHGIGEGPVPMRLAYTGEYRGNDHLIELLAEHQPLPSRAYRYSNTGYNVATLAMDRVTGESWKATLDRLIFKPLGMRNTGANVSPFPVNRLAMPYRSTPDGFERLPYGKVDANMQSAGGLVTTLEDEARWLEAQLNQGRVDGRQVLPAAAVRVAQTIHARNEQTVRGVQVAGYALGWNVGQYKGDTLFTHGGGFPGFATHISFMPGRRIAIVTMANSGDLGSTLTELVAQAVYDALAGSPPLSGDSLTALRGLAAQQRAGIKADRDRRAARPQTTPLPFTAYAGRYENPVMGSLELTLNAEGKLEARAGAAWSAVEVFDGTRHQLRVELFGGGSVLTMEVEGERVVAVGMNGVRYQRVRQQ